MIEIISFIFIFVVCGYVAAPLLTKKPHIIDPNTNDVHHQKQLIRETIRDLEFDYQTGKLSEQDYKMLIAEREAAIQKAESKFSATGTSKNILNGLETAISKAKNQLQQKLACPQCGSKYEKGDKFCSNCGARL